MNKWTTTMLAAALAAGAIGCAQFAGISTLRGADAATADQAGDAKAYTGTRPGSTKPIARTFNEQPPLVPHAVDNFDEITVADNQCLECHSPAAAPAKKAPAVASTHLVNGQLSMNRYQCNSCHVPQVDAKPLVDNAFVGVTKK